MGCSYSNLEPDENRPPAGRFALQWLRLRRGKNCIISTTELLHRDNPDAATTATPRSDWKVHSGRSKLTVCKDNEEDKGGSTMRSNNEELPGSPSFRFYFNAQPVASDDDGNGAQIMKRETKCCAAWYASCPGLKMLCLYSSEDAQGLLMAAVRDPDSVVFLENEFLYGESFPVSAEVLDSSFCLPIGKAKAADILSKEGINTELNSHSKEFM